MDRTGPHTWAAPTRPWCRSVDDELRTYLIRTGAPYRPASRASSAMTTISVASLSNWSFTQRWAWEELQRRLRVCLDQGRPPTGLLAFWAATVVAGRSETADGKTRTKIEIGAPWQL